MIGLPTEEDEDVRGIVETGARALQRSGGEHVGKRAEVTVSVSTHVPKPHTPFQWCAHGRARRDRAQAGAAARRGARALRVDLKMHENHAVAHRGHVRARRSPAAPTCSSARAARGARFDGWDEQLRARAAGTRRFAETRRRRVAALPRHHPGDRAAAVGPHRRRPRGRLPAQEYRKALKDRLSPAVRQGRRHAAAPHEPRRRRGRRSASWSATTAASPATWTR